MIAVAIVGVLAGILVYGLQKPANKVKAGSEVQAMFAEFHRAQAQYKLENGVFYATVEYPGSPTKTAQTVTAPDDWNTLRIQPTAQKLYCSYTCDAGTADDPISATAESFGMEQPAGVWYTLFAECDVDGDGTRSQYFSSSVDASLRKLGDGE